MISKPLPKIAPSMLSGDFANLASECQRMLSCGADYIHMDIMDGHFVPNLTMGPPVIKSLRKHTGAFLDCHLMVSKPEMWVQAMADAGASLFMFHIEATENPQKLIESIRQTNMKIGVAVKPSTCVKKVFHIADSVDMILVMSVEPGFGGQTFMPSCLEKIRALRSKFPFLDIEVDGGITVENTKLVVEAGANVIVAGSSIFGSPDPAHTISKMKSFFQ